MNAVEVFQSPAGQQIRTTVRAGEPWFSADDVCAVLGLDRTRDALSALDEDEKSREIIAGTIIDFVAEPGLYSLILRSRKPEAKAFKRWVTHDVLPAIRKTGGYTTAPALPQTYAEALRELAFTVEQRDAAVAQVAELEPRAAVADHLLDATGDYSVADAAKVLSRDQRIQLGQQRLFTYLSELGWVYRQTLDNRWRIYQAAAERGWLSELPSSHYHPRTGELVLDAPQIRVSPKGMAELHKRLTRSAQPELGAA